MSYEASERETIVSSSDELKTWNVYTLQRTVITKLQKAGVEPVKVDDDGAHYYEDLSWEQVSFRKKSSARNYSEEYLESLKERGRKMGEDRVKNKNKESV